jgi:diguanylate cyclase (GGDEF)-like protein
MGDQIIDRVARLLREQIRSDDLIAQESVQEDVETRPGQELHARFGGDEFCFLIPDLDHYSDAWVIAERFREAVERFDWVSEDRRLADKPPKVDVGVVCLLLGNVGERRHIARQLAHELLARADKLMYEAKGERASHVYPLRVRVDAGALIEVGPDEYVD